ncbi:MAG: alpha-2-macroglobulin, partial [Thermoguttaceae bacterium]
ERAAQWGTDRFAFGPARKKNPVYSRTEVTKMVEDGIKRLTEMQLSDGGWGWFSGYHERSSAHITALVVHGLRLATKCDAVVDQNVIARGEQWLVQYQTKQVQRLKNGELPEEQRNKLSWDAWKLYADDTDAFVMMVLSETDNTGEMSADMKQMRDYLWRDRTKLSLYSVSMFGISLQKWGDDKDRDRAKECLRMLSQYVVVDTENQTAYLNLAATNNWCWWSWYGSEYETQAYFLRMLMNIEPNSEVAPQLVKYLLNNRKNATYWNSTRDTAICVEAFAEYLRISGETAPDMTLEIVYDGEVKRTVEITAKNMFTIDNTYLLEGEAVTTGEHKIEFRKKGTGPLYFNAYLQNFTLEDPITQAGLDVKVNRKFYQLKRNHDATQAVAANRGQAVQMKVEKYDRIPIADLSQVKSGDLVEIELTVESKNDYECIMIEDMKAAGCEPVELQSGYNGNALGAYVEFRDNRVTFFVYKLARGKHSVSYQLRAEQPGVFSALPAKIEAMYAPELKGNSNEFKLEITE